LLSTLSRNDLLRFLTIPPVAGQAYYFLPILQRTFATYAILRITRFTCALLRTILLYSLQSILERFPLLLFGGAKIKTLFLTTKFFSIFFRTFFHSSFRISVNGSAKVVQQIILTNKFHENITRNVLTTDYQYIKF